MVQEWGQWNAVALLHTPSQQGCSECPPDAGQSPPAHLSRVGGCCFPGLVCTGSAKYERRAA